MANYLKDYSKLPEQLLTAAATPSASTRDFCTFDTSDCGSDCAKDSCGYDWVCQDNGGCPKDTGTLNPPSGTGTLTLVSKTSNSVTLRLKSIANSDYYETAYRKSSTSAAVYGEVYSLTWTVDGLEPNTEYVFNYRGANDSGHGPFMSSGLVVQTSPKITTFDWTYAGLNNGSIIYGKEKVKGYGIYVSANEWNELAALVTQATGKHVTEVSSGTPISASIVNTMASALGIPTVQSGKTEITASFFNQLRSAYNALA